MTRKEQNKILDAKIESNVNQYKVDRLNAETSAFSSGDLNKYEFLKRIDLNYKPNALDKARFKFSPLGKTFSTGLDKNVQGYKEEGVIKLLKDIRYSLARPPRPSNNRDDNDDNNDNDNDNDDNDNDNDDDDYYDNRPNDERYDNRVFLNNLNTNLNNIQNDSEHYARLIAYQKVTIGKLKEELTDKNNLTQEIIDQARETIDDCNKERLKYYNKYKNTLVDYTNALENLNKAENTYGKEIGSLNNAINEFRNKIQNLENAEKKSSEIINKLNDELENKNILENDKETLLEKIDDLIDTNNKLEDFIREYDNNVHKTKYKIYDELNKFKNNMEDDMNNFNEKFKIKKNKLNARLDKLNNYVEKLNNYIRENNDKIINTENKLGNANNEYNNLLLEYNRLNKNFIKIKDDLHKTKNKPNESEKIKKELNCKNNEIIKSESELNDKKNIISVLENNISDLKNKNLLINKYEQEIQELNKKLNEHEENFNNEEKNRIKKDNEIKRNEQEIQELNKKLNDYKNKEEEKIYGNIPYLETEEEAAENIADIYERRDNKARTFAPPHNVDDNTRKKDNVDDIEESDEEIEESDEEIDEKTKKYMKKLFKKYDDTREKDTPTKIPQSVKKKIHQLKYRKA